MFYNPENGTITYPSPGSSHGHSGHFVRAGHGHHGHNSHANNHHHQSPTYETTTLMSIITTLATTVSTSTTTTTTMAPPTTTTESSMEALFSFENFTQSNENSTDLLGDIIGLTTEVHLRKKRGLRGPYSMYECRRSDIMGALVQNASPFLFPCTIEYSLVRFFPPLTT